MEVVEYWLQICERRKPRNRVTIWLGSELVFEMKNRDTIWEIVTRFNNFLTKFT